MHKKRILAVFITVMMILNMLPVFSFAASQMTVTAANTEIFQGTTTAKVEIKVSDNPGIAYLAFKVGYDSEKMSLASVETSEDVFAGSDFIAGNKAANPYNVLAANYKGNTDKDGVLLTLNFDVNADCPAGTYDISLSGAESYNIDEESINLSLVNGSVKVSKKSITGVTFSGAEFNYDGTEKEITVKGTLPAGAKVDYTDNKGKKANTYNAVAVVKADGYEDLTLKAKMVIKPKSLTVSGLAAENKSYDGTANAEVKGGVLNGTVAGDDISAIFPKTGTFADVNVGKNIAVNISDVVLTGDDKDNYVLEQPAGLKADIEKAVLSVKADDVTITQGSNIPVLTYTITNGQLFGNDEITGSPATTADGNNLGKFEITKGTLAVNSNYSLSFTKGLLTVIDKIPQNITVSGITEKTYGDAPFVITVEPDSASKLTDFVFESSNTDVAEIASDGTVTIKSAGETDITVKQAGSSEYAAFENTQKLVVNKKGITITSINGDEKTSVLQGVLEADASAVDLDYSKLNIEVGDAVSETVLNVVFTNFALVGDKAGNYTVTMESVNGEMTDENIVAVVINADNGTVTGAGKYIKGSSVTVVVVPNSGYNFSGWYINDESVYNETNYTFIADADTELTAKFAVRSSGGGGSSGGSIVSDITEDTEWKNPFTDVNKGDWYYENVKYTVENGLFNGMSEDIFAPNGIITRAMFVTVLYRAEGEPSSDSNTIFTDVNSSAYYASAVAWAQKNGIVNGVSETEFAPDREITREQIAAMMLRYANYKGTAPTGNWVIELEYADTAEISDYAVEGVMYCSINSIMQGKSDNRFAPKDSATRAEIAAILNRFIESNK